VDDGPINVADFERLGAEKLEQGPRDYFAGGEGVARVLGLPREELELALGLCGCTSPAELTRAHVRRAPFTSVYSV
jgi:2-methylcitrate dehydratase PrpD